MTSRPRTADPSLHFSTSSPSSYTFPARPSRTSLRETTNISSQSAAAVDARPQRPGLVSRTSEASTKTIRPGPRHHLRVKSSSVIPTLSTLNVGNTPNTRQSPTMTSSSGQTSSGAADLLRQAMMQR